MMSKSSNDVVNAVKYLKEAGALFYAVGCKKGLGLCKFGLAKLYYECWPDLLKVMPDKNEDTLIEASLNFVQNALKLFKQIGYSRGELYSEKLEDLLKKKTHNQDRNFKSTKYYIDLAKKAQKEGSDIKSNSWISGETTLLLGNLAYNTSLIIYYIEVTIDDFSHLPPTEQHLIKKVNGTLINLKAKKEKKRNVGYIVPY